MVSSTVSCVCLLTTSVTAIGMENAMMRQDSRRTAKAKEIVCKSRKQRSSALRRQSSVDEQRDKVAELFSSGNFESTKSLDLECIQDDSSDSSSVRSSDGSVDGSSSDDGKPKQRHSLDLYSGKPSSAIMTTSSKTSRGKSRRHCGGRTTLSVHTNKDAETMCNLNDLYNAVDTDSMANLHEQQLRAQGQNTDKKAAKKRRDEKKRMLKSGSKTDPVMVSYKTKQGVVVEGRVIGQNRVLGESTKYTVQSERFRTAKKTVDQLTVYSDVMEICPI